MSQVRLPSHPEPLTQLGVPGVPGLRLDTLSSSPGLHPSAGGSDLWRVQTGLILVCGQRCWNNQLYCVIQ